MLFPHAVKTHTEEQHLLLVDFASGFQHLRPSTLAHGLDADAVVVAVGASDADRFDPGAGCRGDKSASLTERPNPSWLLIRPPESPVSGYTLEEPGLSMVNTPSSVTSLTSYQESGHWVGDWD